jgi:hypothetical protein
MFSQSEIYKKYILLPSSPAKNIINQRILWIAIFGLFILANLSPTIAKQIISIFLTLVSPSLIEKTDKLFEWFFLPFKGWLFLIGFLIIIYPIIKSVWQARNLFSQLNTKRIFIASGLIFIILSLLVFPYSYPNGLNAGMFGLSGLGIDYGDMSLAPFAEDSIFVYRRMLQPAIAHFIQMDGPVLYFIYSLLCTYILIVLSLIFIESKIVQNKEFGQRELLTFKQRFLLYISLATSSYLMTCFLWPGYPEQLTFILILLMACIPMNNQARLGIFTLCMLAHDGSAFALTPIALFCLPKSEKYQALFVLFLFFGVLLALYGAGLNNKLGTDHLGVGGKSNFQILLENPGLALAGLWFVYKFLWGLFIALAYYLWQRKEKATLLAIAAISLFPALMTFIALDTTRLAGFGFLGMLITCSILLIEFWQKISQYHRYLLLVIIYGNILIPSHTVVLTYPDTFSTYPYRGIYQLIYSGFHLLLRNLF